MLQIGTRNMANFGLLQAVGTCGKPVLLKRGMTATIEEWLMAAEYIAQRGNLDIVLCERGIRTFETAYPQHPRHLGGARSSRRPATCRSSSTRATRPAARTSSSRCPARRSRSAPTACIVDVHPHPEAALCDGPQALDGSELRELATAVRRLPPLVGRVDAGVRVRTS